MVIIFNKMSSAKHLKNQSKFMFSFCHGETSMKSNTTSKVFEKIKNNIVCCSTESKVERGRIKVDIRFHVRDDSNLLMSIAKVQGISKKSSFEADFLMLHSYGELCIKQLFQTHFKDVFSFEEFFEVEDCHRISYEQTMFDWLNESHLIKSNPKERFAELVERFAVNKSDSGYNYDFENIISNQEYKDCRPKNRSPKEILKSLKIYLEKNNHSCLRAFIRKQYQDNPEAQFDIEMSNTSQEVIRKFIGNGYDTFQAFEKEIINDPTKVIEYLYFDKIIKRLMLSMKKTILHSLQLQPLNLWIAKEKEIKTTPISKQNVPKLHKIMVRKWIS